MGSTYDWAVRILMSRCPFCDRYICRVVPWDISKIFTMQLALACCEVMNERQCVECSWKDLGSRRKFHKGFYNVFSIFGTMSWPFIPGLVAGQAVGESLPYNHTQDFLYAEMRSRGIGFVPEGIIEQVLDDYGEW